MMYKEFLGERKLGKIWECQEKQNQWQIFEEKKVGR